MNGYRLLYVSKEKIIAARKTNILESRDGGATWIKIAALPICIWKKAIMSFALYRRLFRKGVHRLAIGNSTSLVIADHSVYLISKGEMVSRGPLHGARPLAICAVNDAFYYGEYSRNYDRSDVHIWRLYENEKEWYPVWQFSGIRHVHGVFYDIYKKVLWVTTGDLDKEAGIWRTDDEFATLQKIVGGSQSFRAVQLLFTNEHVYFGSDAPGEQNHIFRMDRAGNNVEKLAAVGSSVFYGCKVGKQLFFSTVVEPSRVNKTRYVEVWGSKDGNSWQVVHRFKKDIWSMKYFQYGQAFFPAGPGDDENLWINPFATKNGEKTYKYNTKDLFSL